jgi:prepilin-type N-terminal cleavage/methylation domain-containing protein
MKNRKNRKAFTLIELLIVIAIIAVLATVVILSLNPAELLRQARDSNRVSDAATLKSAIALYLADQASPSMGSSSVCYITIATGSLYTPSTGGNWGATTTCGAWMGTALTTVNNSTTRGITGGGSGWLPINFSAISSGAPIGNEPVDPTNLEGNCTGNPPASLSSCSLFYSYVTTSSANTYKIGMFMESSKYTSGSGNVETNTYDGGINNYVYEAGTNLAL